MVEQIKTVLIVGFNTRPLAYSLKNSGYGVYAVDFFGDLDLYPNVQDCLVLIKELATNYSSIKERYSMLLAKYAIRMLKKYPEIDFLIIGSGLDDAYEEREMILNEVKNEKYKIKDLNNDIEIIKEARDIESIYAYLKSVEIVFPFTFSYDKLKLHGDKLRFPCIFKKPKSAGGVNVFKIEHIEELSNIIRKFKLKKLNPLEWVIQEYIEGIPVSCTTISNGRECEVISINQQIIGERLLNSPKEFMYCGNTVPADIPEEDKKLISKISKLLSDKIGLKGITGFDYVLRDHQPYLMEINPRIPGSIRATETSLNLNLLELHIKSFDLNKWDSVKNQVKSTKFNNFATKFIFFAPRDIDKSLLSKINNLECIHDKSEPNKNILKREPLCTILTEAKDRLESYNKALKIVNKINEIIG